VPGIVPKSVFSKLPGGDCTCPAVLFLCSRSLSVGWGKGCIHAGVKVVNIAVLVSSRQFLFLADQENVGGSCLCV